MNSRLRHFLLPPVLLCASLSCAAQPVTQDKPEAGCDSLLNVVRRSLEDEIGAACPGAAASQAAPASACTVQREPLRAIVDFIGKRQEAEADQCETLLEVNKRLRTLPPKG